MNDSNYNDWKNECLKRLRYSRNYDKYSKENLIDELYEKDEEIEKLNNIINELDKFISKALEVYNNIDVKTLLLVKDKLKALKEGE